MVKVGILAIQGDFAKHEEALANAGASSLRVLRQRDLDDVDSLILPGGESTTIAKGIDRLSLREPLEEFAASGRPVLGTCAGAILLSRRAENHPVPTLSVIDLVTRRNAYGTQVNSFAATADADSDPAFTGLRCVFIRAPALLDLGEDVEVKVRVDGRPVLVREGNVLACTFHPELTGDDRVHRYLLSACRIARASSLK